MKRTPILPELLSPAGNFEKLRSALYFGADAVYFAGKKFGMRAAADNFDDAEVREAIEYCHRLGKKCYVALNTFPRSDEFKDLEREAARLSEIRPDGLIVADLGVFRLCRKLAPGVPLHISTQAGCVNADACRAWFEMGAKRIVLARELSLEEIRKIRCKTPAELELEAFIHGSMCVAFSGRCHLSEYYTGRDANRGECTQPCRWNYRFYEEKRPDDVLSFENTPEGSFLFGSKDLCMIEHVRDLVESGLTSLKIEGRMKSAYYAAVTANAYRMALDSVSSGREVPVIDLKRELESVSHREYSTGYYFDSPRSNSQIAEQSGYSGEKDYSAKVIQYDAESKTALCIQKNKCSIGDSVEILMPGKTGIPLVISEMKDEAGIEIKSANHPQMSFRIKIPFEVHEGDLIRQASDKNFV